MTQDSYSIDDTLPQLARFAWDRAPVLCDKEHGCRDYHRAWSMIRWLELGGALPVGMEFFHRELEKARLGENARILVSGGADTGLLSLVIRAQRKIGVMPGLIFTDQCLTTIQQNQLLARQQNIPLKTYSGDICRLDCDPVDIIVAHSFLLFFPQPQRQQVTDTWARLLKPGGVVLMSQGVSVDEKTGPPPKDQAKIEERKPAIIDKAKRVGFTATEAQEVGDAAVKLWKMNLMQTPFITRQNLVEGFIKSGLIVEQLQSLEKEGHGPLRAFTKESKARIRIELVARK